MSGDSPLPTFGDPTPEGADGPEHGQAERGALVPWLPDPEQCPECDTLMQADVVYDPREARHVHAWTCPSCDTSIPRDPVHDQEAPQPSEGASKLRSLFP